MHILSLMDVEWDAAKNESNFADHEVRFEDAEVALFDPNGWTMEDIDVEGEQRFRTLGMDAVGQLVVVVYTYRAETVRLISAWKANQRERREYGKGL